jgi:superfamily I DNA/RNA helicase
LQKDGLHSIKEEEDSKVVVYEVPSDKYEAKAICSTITESPVNQDALILVPGRRFAAPIKREMRKRRIPYDCKSSVADSGINSINDLFKWLKNEKDNFSFRLILEKIVNNPTLKIPFEKANGIKQKRERTLSKISNFWIKVISEKATIFDILQVETDGNNDLNFICNLLFEIKNVWEDGKSNSKFLETVGKVIRPWPSVKSMSVEIEDWVEDAFAKNASGGESVARVLTMEAAKGLGSDQVFVVGLNKEIFPPNGLNREALHEKQRLLYVSMTRAKKKLHMYYSRTREGRFSFQQAPDGIDRGTLEPSPFLEWLPLENVDFQERWPGKKKKNSSLEMFN